MRKLIVSELVTLDGVMEAPGGEPSHVHTGWVEDFMGPQQIEYKFREVLDAETLLVGRVTYESFAGAWPTYEGEFADRMNSMEKVVVSGTLSDPEWTNTKVLRGDPAKTVAELKAGEGGPIVVGGSHTLVHALLENDLVDELRLMVFPVTIGSGMRLFPASTRKTVWRQVGDSVLFESGARLDVYHPVLPTTT